MKFYIRRAEVYLLLEAKINLGAPSSPLIIPSLINFLKNLCLTSFHFVRLLSGNFIEINNTNNMTRYLYNANKHIGVLFIIY